jgi:transcriptional regulator with XRE-family HTH domain
LNRQDGVVNWGIERMARTTDSAPHHVDKHVGALIRAQRKARGMPQTELAEALGVTFQQIQKYERGANRVSSSKLYEIAQKLDTPLVTFFEGLDHPDAARQTPGGLIDFLSERGSQDLVVAFKAMKPELRKHLVALAMAMSDADGQSF